MSNTAHQLEWKAQHFQCHSVGLFEFFQLEHHWIPHGICFPKVNPQGSQKSVKKQKNIYFPTFDCSIQKNTLKSQSLTYTVFDAMKASQWGHKNGLEQDQASMKSKRPY